VAEFKLDLAKVHRHFRDANGGDYNYLSVLHWKSHRPHTHLLYRTGRDGVLTRPAFRAALETIRPGAYTHNHVDVQPIGSVGGALDYACYHKNVPDHRLELAPRGLKGLHHFCASKGFLPRRAFAYWAKVKEHWLAEAELRKHERDLAPPPPHFAPRSLPSSAPTVWAATDVEYWAAHRALNDQLAACGRGVSADEYAQAHAWLDRIEAVRRYQAR
jgi:hypothetical protein